MATPVNKQDKATLTTQDVDRKTIERRVKDTFNDSRFSAVAKDLAEGYGKYKGSIEGVLDPISDFTSAIGGSAEAIMNASQTGVFETVTFPKNFSRELCLRLDFVRYDRKNRFETSKVYPAACCILPLPQSLQFGQGVAYNFTNLGLFGQMETALRQGDFSDLEGTIRSAGQSVAAGVEATQSQGVVAGIGTGIKKISESLSASSSAGAVTSAAAYGGLRLLQGIGEVAGVDGIAAGITQNLGVIPNPHLATAFQGIEPRSFNFRMVLQVSSQDESIQLQEMIRTLRKYYLPALSTDRTALSYPHEVNVSFSEGGYSKDSPRTPGDQLFAFKRCVLESVTVDVGSDGTPAFFHNLEPTAVTLDLTFREVEISTANDFGLDPGKGIVEAITTNTGAKNLVSGIGKVVETAASPFTGNKENDTGT